MATAFPEVVAATQHLPKASTFDGELIVWESGRLAFERLQEDQQPGADGLGVGVDAQVIGDAGGRSAWCR